MRHFASVATILLGLIAAMAWFEPADAKKRAGSRADRISISYVPPKNPDHQEIYDRMKKRRVLERFKEVLSPIRLPKNLLLKLEGCDGVSNAWYSEAEVTVCYEYIDELIKNAPAEAMASAQTETSSPQYIEAIVGPIIEVFLHEVGHAIFDLLKVPVFGREEDAADQFAAYMLLQFPTDEAQLTIRGVARMYSREAQAQSPGFKQFADSHGLPAQRLVNLLCLTYGAKPKDPEIAKAVAAGLLPENRADGCEDEYNQVEYAFRTLIRPHMDAVRAKKLKRKHWLR